MFPRQSGKWNHFCYFISIYAKFLFRIPFNRKSQIELLGPLTSLTDLFDRPEGSNSKVLFGHLFKKHLCLSFLEKSSLKLIHLVLGNMPAPEAQNDIRTSFIYN